MKRRLAPTLLFLSLCACALLPAADNAAPPPAAAAAPASLAGHYAGTWKGPDATGGALRLALKRDAAGAWTAEAAFTFEANEVPMKLKSVQVDGAKIKLEFDWVIDGTTGQSKLTGEAAGGTLSGTYQTVTEPPSSGTWSVTRKD
jgi:hypothetical protein